MLNILKTEHWVTSGPRHFFATVLVSFAALGAIGTIATVAKIAYDEQSWVALVVLIVTMVQVRYIIVLYDISRD